MSLDCRAGADGVVAEGIPWLALWWGWVLSGDRGNGSPNITSLGSHSVGAARWRGRLFSRARGFWGAAALAPLPGSGPPWDADPVVSLCSTTGYLLGCLRHQGDGTWHYVYHEANHRLPAGMPLASTWAASGISVGCLRDRGGLPLGSRRNAFGIMRGGLRDCRRARSPGALWRGILTARGIP